MQRTPVLHNLSARGALLLAVSLLVACGGSEVSQGLDAGALSDAAIRDAGNLADAQTLDGGFPDVRAADTGPSDSGQPDSGTTDGGVIDSGTPDGGLVDAGNPAVCTVSLCMAGAFTRRDGANPDFEALCDQLPDLIRDGNETLFGFRDRGGALEALVAALDTNSDGRVDLADDDCDIRLLGYSWGGVNITLVGQEFIDDGRVALERSHIELMVAVDPYAPTAGSTIEVPAEVQVFWELRHSISPSNDCSGAAPLGPYEGLPPLCFGTTECHDHDYSLAPSQQFSGATSNYRGNEVGHCGVVDVATPAVLHTISTGSPYSNLPPSVAVGSR